MDDLRAAWADDPPAPSHHTRQETPRQQAHTKDSVTRARGTASNSSENSFTGSVASAGRHIFHNSQQFQRGGGKGARGEYQKHRGRGGKSGGKATPRTDSGNSGSSGDRPILKQSMPGGLDTPPSSEGSNRSRNSSPHSEQESTMSFSPGSSPPPAKPGPYGPNKTNLADTRDREWPYKQEGKIKLTKLPRYISMREIHSAMSRFGTVYSIEMHRARNESWVIFR